MNDKKRIDRYKKRRKEELMIEVARYFLKQKKYRNEVCEYVVGINKRQDKLDKKYLTAMLVVSSLSDDNLKE